MGLLSEMKENAAAAAAEGAAAEGAAAEGGQESAAAAAEGAAAAAEGAAAAAESGEPKSFWEEKKFKSREDFVTHYDGLEKSIEQKESERFALEKDLLGQIESLKEKQVMFNDDDDLVRLSVLKNKEDKSEYKAASKLLFGNTDPMKVMINSLKDKYKDFDEADIKEIIKKKYNLDTEAPDDIAEPIEHKRWKREQAMGQADLEEAAQSIISKQREEFDKIELPYNKPKSKEQRVIEQVNAKKEWEPYYAKSVEAVGKLTKTVPVGDNQTVEVVLDLDDESKEKYIKMLSNYVYDNAVSATEANANKLGAMLRDVIKADREEAMDIAKGEAMNEWYANYYEQKTTNPSPDGKPKEATPGESSGKGLKDMFAYLKNK